ncbi:MAG TPA: beta-ketoacyl synthase N-terminal-like domain-containing protein [Thermoanaerobaculia bacterium]|jgi:acyl transferase domain-containing protein
MTVSASPIAVTGMACRYPGESSTPGRFWRFLRGGGDGIAPVPRERWNSTLSTPRGRPVPPHAGFLGEPFPHSLDAQFFDLSPQEAAALDPQQRLLLEVAWETLEHAGIPAPSLRGANVGVFAAVSTGDYARATLWREPRELDPFVATGAAFSAAAGRLAWYFGFEGPAMSVDTACSSGLVAFHLACQALRAGECDAALVAGVNALLAPHLFVCLAEMNLLSPDGRCKSFDASANGYARAEGCGALLLERADDARANGRRIVALARGSAVNQDGRSNGLTAPNQSAQEKVIRRALACAALEPEEISYVEAHGTGTPLGDLVETRALSAVHARRATPLVIGSVKTNIGHLEAGAGIAGIIKTILALQHEELPPHLHLRERNGEIDWKLLALPREATPWPRGTTLRRAGVSSFGFTGTNAHVILEEAPEAVPTNVCTCDGYVLPLSAKTPEALDALRLLTLAFLIESPDDLGDICFTAARGRARFEHRLTVAGRTREELIRALESRDHAAVDAHPCDAHRIVTLPFYPFQRRRHWIGAELAPPAPPLLALAEERTPGGKARFTAAVGELAASLVSDAPQARLDDELPLVEQGFTSLLALQLRARLEAALQCELSPTLLFNYPSIRRLSDYLLELVRGSDPPPSDDDDVAFLDELDLDELHELINQELNDR